MTNFLFFDSKLFTINAKTIFAQNDADGQRASIC